MTLQTGRMCPSSLMGFYIYLLKITEKVPEPFFFLSFSFLLSLWSEPHSYKSKDGVSFHSSLSLSVLCQQLQHDFFLVIRQESPQDTVWEMEQMFIAQADYSVSPCGDLLLVSWLFLCAAGCIYLVFALVPHLKYIFLISKDHLIFKNKPITLFLVIKRRRSRWNCTEYPTISERWDGIIYVPRQFLTFSH